MNETLQEFVDSRGLTLRVDREQGILRGVKILGQESRNGRRYLPEAMAKAAGLYEGAKVNVNHPKGNPAGPRDYQDRIGVLRHVAVQEEGLFADFHFNPKHALAEQLLWDAEHACENVGFSHNVLARTGRRGEQTVVEDILRVQSVDLVADPATTQGLFEAESESEPQSNPEPTEPGASLPQLLAGLSAEQLRQHCPEFIQRVAAGLSVEELRQHCPELIQRVAAGLSVDELRQHCPELIQRVAGEVSGEAQRLRAELDQLRAAEAVREKHQRVRAMLREFQLPDPDSADAWARAVVSPRFLEQLLASPDERVLRELLEDRVRLMRASLATAPRIAAAGTPLCREQNLADPPPPSDAKTFVADIT